MKIILYSTILLFAVLLSNSSARQRYRRGDFAHHLPDDYVPITKSNHLERMILAFDEEDYGQARALLYSPHFTYEDTQLDFLLEQLRNKHAVFLWPYILEQIPRFPGVREREEVQALLYELYGMKGDLTYAVASNPALVCIARLGTEEGLRWLKDLFISSPYIREKERVVRVLMQHQSEQIDRLFADIEESDAETLELLREQIITQQNEERERRRLELLLSEEETAKACEDLGSGDEEVRFQATLKLKRAKPDDTLISLVKQAFLDEQIERTKAELLVAFCILERADNAAVFLRSLLKENDNMDEVFRIIINALLRECEDPDKVGPDGRLIF